MTLHLSFTSTLPADPECVWRWITDVRSLRAEMHPWLWMSLPKGLCNLEDLSFEPGQPLFTSWLWLFGVIPIGTCQLTLQSLNPGASLVEQSPTTFMRRWRHARRIELREEGTRLTDELTIDPLLPAVLVRPLLQFFFNSRHRTLRRRAAHQGL
jgi:ligand-binding SRPBCC domain-containing protein